MPSTSQPSINLILPPEIQRTFERSSAFLAYKYDGVAPSPEELAIFYLAGAEPHEVVTNLERQVLQISGSSLPDKDDHLVQTYLEMERTTEYYPKP
ncbi:hypothetical protein [Pelagicoccus sp. SDUM812002]|uniref:hypothetical protein n=1 Tax=Pelagicoccus sp. SDUM812002 TaxID=3041266 RepID=UPI00280F07FA|nr:hypothetical protein [Pelagicoccus sp. SDUM812002]MDQ8184248.1 hypothetical protein [Pelagicoccus sp. SDUM812002]